MHLLIIEDDPVIAEVLVEGLRENGITTQLERDGSRGLQRALAERFDLILLDVLLPGADGWTVCRNLRARGVSTPILILTARDTLDDRVRGLDTGADDYLTKPFQFAELLARIRAQVRRDKPHRARVIRIADLEIDTVAETVYRSGRRVQLTRREFTLLQALAQNEGQVLSRELIQQRIWRDDESYTDTVKVHILSLRRKLDDGRPYPLIETVRGSGYRLRRPDQERVP